MAFTKPQSCLLLFSVQILTNHAHELITPFPKDKTCSKYPCYYNLNGLTQNGAKRFSYFDGIVDSFILDRGFVQGTQVKFDKPATTSIYRTKPRFSAVVFGDSIKKKEFGYMHSIYNQNSGVIDTERSKYEEELQPGSEAYSRM